MVRDGVQGRWAVSDADWERVLVEMAALTPDERHAMGSAARARVEEAFSLSVCADRLAELLHEVASA